MLACISPYEVLLCGGSWQEQRRKKETNCTQVTRHLCLISYNCRAISWMNELTQPDKCSPRQATHRAHQTHSSKLPSKSKTPVAWQPNWILNQSFVKEKVAVWDKYFCVDSHTAKNEHFFANSRNTATSRQLWATIGKYQGFQSSQSLYSHHSNSPIRSAEPDRMIYKVLTASFISLHMFLSANS